jgi:hypothetical protein
MDADPAIAESITGVAWKDLQVSYRRKFFWRDPQPVGEAPSLLGRPSFGVCHRTRACSLSARSGRA